MVEVSNKHKSITVSVSSNNGNTIVAASSDTSQYWANASKKYSEEAKVSANLAEQAKNEVIAQKDIILADIESVRAEAVESVTEIATTGVASVEKKVNTGIANIEAKTTVGVELIEAKTNNSVTKLDQETEQNKQEIKALANVIKDNADDIINRVGLNMFDPILKDHVLTYEESKGLALQGTYVYKDAIAGSRYGYPDFYAKCLEEYNEATSTETVNGVTVKVHSNGHKFYDIANKTAIDEFFNTMGSAWFYGIDTENECVFLPRDKYFAVAGVASVTGNGMTLGLTNGSANYVLAGGVNGHDARFAKYQSNIDSTSGDPGLTIYGRFGVTTDPTKSGIEARLETSEDKYLYICVGNTVSDTSWVDVVTQVNGGVKDLEDKTLEGIERLKASSNALTTTQITNCITEIPQNIKLELADGTLTLKAGSKVIVPNGFEENGTTPKFDYLTIEEDITKTSSGNASTFLCFDTTINALRCRRIIDSCSGATITTSSSAVYWYDTINNRVGVSSDKGVTWTYGCSLPLAILTESSTEIISIDQVFNGFGYIGSTIWVDKGVKGLIPNGRDEDGSLNNIEWVNDKLKLRTFTFSATNGTLGFSPFQTNQIQCGQITYNETDNIQYSGSFSWLLTNLGTCTLTNGVVTNFQPKQTFRAIDYSDKSTMSGWALPSSKYVDLTLGASGTTYTAPANGYIYLNKSKTAQTQYIALVNETVAMGVWSNGNPAATNGMVYTYIPVKKDDIVSISYSSSGTTNFFRFIYAEGEV